MTTPAELDALIERINALADCSYWANAGWDIPGDATQVIGRLAVQAAAALVQLRDENARLDADHNRIGAKCDALQQKVGRMRRALRQLNKAHHVLWRMILYRNEFHDFAVKQGAFIEFRNATEKRP